MSRDWVVWGLGILAGLLLGIPMGINVGKERALFSNPFTEVKLSSSFNQTGAAFKVQSNALLERSGKVLQRGGELLTEQGKQWQSEPLDEIDAHYMSSTKGQSVTVTK